MKYKFYRQGANDTIYYSPDLYVLPTPTSPAARAFLGDTPRIVNIYLSDAGLTKAACFPKSSRNCGGASGNNSILKMVIAHLEKVGRATSSQMAKALKVKMHSVKNATGHNRHIFGLEVGRRSPSWYLLKNEQCSVVAAQNEAFARQMER